MFNSALIILYNHARMCALSVDGSIWCCVLGEAVCYVMKCSVVCVYCCVMRWSEWWLCVYNCISGVIQFCNAPVTTARSHFCTSAQRLARPPSVRRSRLHGTPSIPGFGTFPAFGRGRLKPCARSYKIIPRKQLPLTLKPLHPIPPTFLLSHLRNPTFLANSLSFHLIFSHFIQ